MNELSPLGNFSFPLETIILFGFYFFVGGYVIFTAVLYYHWQTYSTDRRIMGITMLSYFLLTIPLLIGMGILVIGIT